ncbi:BspA family leucine-rich repeat surface protein [Segatella copri]|nr:BspA family leucine-rich repeat surface protein [Segatella copri]
MLLLLPAGMVAQKAASSSKYIATYESSTQTLTFKKNVGETLPKNSAWVEDRQQVATINKNLGNGTIVHIVFDKSFSTYTPTSLYKFFANLTKLKTITGLEYLNTEKVTNMSYMFYNCSSLTSLDVTHFNTAKVTNMNRLFAYCSSLTSLDVTHFNTAKVTNMNRLFAYCSSLTSLDVTHFNTAKVTNMNSLFAYCSSLTSLDVTHFNTAKVTNMNRLFAYCSSLTSLDVTHFNTAKVTNMNRLFAYCSSLTSLDVTHFNTAKVTNMNSLFAYCSSLTSLDVTYFNTANVTGMNNMFYSCSALTTIYASDNFVTDKVEYSYNMFYDCTSLKGTTLEYVASKTDHNYANCGTDGYFTPGCGYAEFDYATGTLTFRYKGVKPEGAYDLNVGITDPGWRTHKNEIKKVVFDASFANARPTSCYYWFYECKNLVNIEGIENLNTEKVTNMALMFASCSDLTSLDVTKFNTANVTTLMSMFSNCSSLKSLDVTNFDTRNVTNMFYMFNNCSGLTSLDVTKFNTAKVRNMYSMFMKCSGLKSLDVTNFDTGNVISMAYMFYGCSALTSLDLTNFNTAKVMDMCFMFKKCSGLTSLNLTKFNTAEVTDMSQMFNECSALTTIYASDEFVTTNVETGSNMFFNCIKLKGFIDYKNNSDKTDHTYANYKTGYFTKLVGKNGDEKIGATGETLATDNLVLDDDKDFVAYEPFAAKAASYSRTMKEGTTWATLCLPFEVSLANQNFRAFKLLSADDAAETVELEEIEGSIEAGTPVIIKMKDGATKLNFTVANMEIANEVKTAETANGNYNLQGIYTQKEFSKDTDNNCYIVKGSKLMNPAKLLDKTTTESVGSKPFRAYMADNSSAPAAGARMFSISVGGSTTAIEQLETTADSKAEYYDLQGRRLQNLQKGVNIVKRGGKTMKVIIK